MEEIFQEPCDAYYKIFTDKTDSGYKYRALSPFEFKNTLIKLGIKHWKGDESKLLNAGRGNPNFFAVMPRYAFSLLTHLATQLGDEETNLFDLGLMPPKKGISKRFHRLLWHYRGDPVGKFLKQAVCKMKRITGFDMDTLVHQIVISTIGCFYPDPPRVQPWVEPVLTEFLDKVIYKPRTPFKNRVKLFPTEGATAAIVYIFDSLKYNGLVVPGDKIGILTPIFSPYLEIPALKNYDLNQVCIKADENDDWDLPDAEIEKIADPAMKAIFMVNPTNPTSISLSVRATRKIRSVVKRSNPGLIVITDNVYAPFVGQFNSLFDTIPYNTIGVYSFSKYFGVTGWRLGCIMMANNNVIDRKLLKSVSPEVNERYSMISIHPERIPFIQRLLIDSRQVAEAHTAGLSTPQQTIMTLFAMFDLLDGRRVYDTTLRHILYKRQQSLLDPIKYRIEESNMNANYYIVIDLIKAVNNLAGGSDFGDYLKQNRDPLEFLLKLAKGYGVVLLPAIGFAGPFWGFRASIANLPDKDYGPIGEALSSLIAEYYEEFKVWKKKQKAIARKNGKNK
jgi:aspartate 4-decarboxylase